VRWPLVRTHPGSKRKLLFVGIHAREIIGWTLPEGRMMLADLLEHATQRQFVHRHEWRVGDLVMWDNRATLHRGRRYDLGERRELRRTTTMALETEEAAA
jgi:alpha-ketoglutarate-dependent 2,4-dichlorophenoxyacetate dioxygenase